MTLMTMAIFVSTTMMAGNSSKPMCKKHHAPEPPKQEVCHECGRKMESAHRHDYQMPQPQEPRNMQPAPPVKKDVQPKKQSVKPVVEQSVKRMEQKSTGYSFGSKRTSGTTTKNVKFGGNR